MLTNHGGTAWCARGWKCIGVLHTNGTALTAKTAWCWWASTSWLPIITCQTLSDTRQNLSTRTTLTEHLNRNANKVTIATWTHTTTKVTDKKHLIDGHQWGFRSIHSTLTALLDLTNDWSFNFDRKMINSTVFLDLQKAFYIIDHEIQLLKISRAMVSTLTQLNGFHRF